MTNSKTRLKQIAEAIQDADKNGALLDLDLNGATGVFQRMLLFYVAKTEPEIYSFD